MTAIPLNLYLIAYDYYDFLKVNKVGIRNLAAPDFGDAVTIRVGEINVFRACGVTSQLAATSTALSRVITHAPGHMFVSDLRDEDLTIL